MAKRLTDSEKWEDPWFLDLPNEYKMLWVYVLDKCDYAGIWKVNKSLAEYCFKQPIDLNKFLVASEDRIQPFDNGKKWFIPKFLTFQYGPYSEGNKMYPKIEAYLLKEGLKMGHLSPINGVKDMDIDMVKEREKREKGKPTVEEVRSLFEEKGCPAEAEKFFDYYEANGWRVGKNPMKNWRAAVANWLRNAKAYDTRGGVQKPVSLSRDYSKDNAEFNAKMAAWKSGA